jgi:hypothetical protein
MIQYSLLGRAAASTRLNTKFRGLAPSPSSGKTLPEDGDGASPRNIVFKRVDAAVLPRRLYWAQVPAVLTFLSSAASLTTNEFDLKSAI